jgi:hypothetical protein
MLTLTIYHQQLLLGALLLYLKLILRTSQNGVTQLF